MAEHYDFNLLPVHNEPEVYEWLSADEENRAGWNVESAMKNTKREHRRVDEAPAEDAQLCLQEANEELRRRSAQVQDLERRVQDRERRVQELERDKMIMGNLICRQDVRIRRMERQLRGEQEGDQRSPYNCNSWPNKKPPCEY
jgi:uncharacterized protein (DUF3084 family)